MTRLVQSLRILPRWIIVVIDTFILCLSNLLGFSLRFNFNLEEVFRNEFLVGGVLNVLLGVAGILITRSYAGIVRYTGLEDGRRIFYSMLLSCAMICMANIGYNYYSGINLVPYSVVIIALLASFLFLFFYRLFIKSIFSYYGNVVGKKFNALIFGAGQAGVIAKQVIDNDTSSNLRIVGFIEDNARKTGKQINGKKIFDAKDIESIITLYDVSELIISINDFPLSRRQKIVDICLKNSVKLRNVPPADQWVKGELSLNQIKNVKIEDLLGRDSIILDNENVRNSLVGKTVLVTGAAGSIGSELVRQIIKYKPKRIVLIDQAETPLHEIDREVSSLKGDIVSVTVLTDIRDRFRLENVFQAYQPDIVFHAAAYKHVPMMENNPAEAIRCNIAGTKWVADFALKYKAEKFVMVSTDKAVNPTNVMGCSKRIAEIYVQSLNEMAQASSRHNTSFITTRFGNVLGSNGSVIPYFRKQIANGGPVTVTHPDITRYFMTIPEACQLVLEAGAMGKGGEIFIFDMGESIKIFDLAKKMISLSGLKVGRDIEIVFTGLRDGEKLYEELLNNKENTLPTYHHKIMIAKVTTQPYTVIDSHIKKLVEINAKGDELAAVKYMKTIVPEFISNASRFEALDEKGHPTVLTH